MSMLLSVSGAMMICCRGILTSTCAKRSCRSLWCLANSILLIKTAPFVTWHVTISVRRWNWSGGSPTQHSTSSRSFRLYRRKSHLMNPPVDRPSTTPPSKKEKTTLWWAIFQRSPLSSARTVYKYIFLKKNDITSKVWMHILFSSGWE